MGKSVAPPTFFRRSIGDPVQLSPTPIGDPVQLFRDPAQLHPAQGALSSSHPADPVTEKSNCRWMNADCSMGGSDIHAPTIFSMSTWKSVLQSELLTP